MWPVRTRTISQFLRQDCQSITSTLCKSSVVFPNVSEQSTDVIKPFEEIPSPGGIYRFPIIGNMLLFAPFSKYGPSNLHVLADKLHDECGKIFKLSLGDNSMVVVEDPKDIETVFRNDGKYPDRGRLEKYIHYAEKNNKEKNFAISNGKEWYNLRSRIHKTIVRPSACHSYLPAQNDVADDFVRLLATRQYTPGELRDEFFKYSTESISVVCFDKRLGCFSDDKSLSPEHEAFIGAIKQFFEEMTDTGIPFYKIYPTPSYKRFEYAANKAYGFGRMLLEESLEEINKKEKEGILDPAKPNLILSLLSVNTSMEAINAVVLDLLVAGTDSTAKNLEFFLLSLALNPDKQELLYQEIKKVVQVGERLTAEHMDLMPYYKACFKESMRFNFPLSLGTIRILQTDLVLSGYRVPKETRVMVNNNRAVRNPEYFENPNQYIPERWQRGRDGRLKEAPPRFAMLPFGFGVRNCIGRRFAEQELWLGVVKIVQSFKVTVSAEDKDHDVVFPLFRTTKRPIQFKFIPR